MTTLIAPATAASRRATCFFPGASTGPAHHVIGAGGPITPSHAVRACLGSWTARRFWPSTSGATLGLEPDGQAASVKSKDSRIHNTDRNASMEGFDVLNGLSVVEIECFLGCIAEVRRE